MNYKRLNSDLLDLIEMRNELNELDFSDETYDDLEDEIHEFEDTFNERYGSDLEVLLERIHERVCPDVEVLLPTAYLAKEYLPSAIEEGSFEIGPDAGILVETILKDAKGRFIDARITYLPNPFRIVMISHDDLKVLWSSEHPESINI
ncbi:MAG: hypothetical protein ACK417_00525 [Bacteroidia bacterium]